MPTFSHEYDDDDDDGSPGEGDMVSQTFMPSLMNLVLFLWCNPLPD